MLETYFVFSEKTPATTNKLFFTEEAALAYLRSLDEEVEADMVVCHDELPF